MPAMKAKWSWPAATGKSAISRPPSRFSPVTLHVPDSPVVRLNMMTGVPAFRHSSARLDVKIVDAMTSMSTLYWSTSSTEGSRSEEHTSELQSLMRISYAVFCLKKKTTLKHSTNNANNTFTLHTHRQIQ